MNREDMPMACLCRGAAHAPPGVAGACRGKTVRTTVLDRSAPSPLTRVNRQLKADRPNQLWVSDFMYASTWQGWQYAAFIIDAFARRFVGWRVSSTMGTDFVLDALEWVSWFYRHRLLESLGYIPPAEAEANYYKQLASQTAKPA